MLRPRQSCHVRCARLSHLASVAAWVGGDLLLCVQTIRLTREGRSASMLAQLDAAGAVVMPPAARGVIVSGVALAVTSGVGFGPLWVQGGVAGVVASTVLAGVFTRRAGRRFEALALVVVRQRTARAISNGSAGVSV